MPCAADAFRQPGLRVLRRGGSVAPLALRLTHIPAGSRTTYSSVLMTRHGACRGRPPKTAFRSTRHASEGGDAAGRAPRLGDPRLDRVMQRVRAGAARGDDRCLGRPALSPAQPRRDTAVRPAAPRGRRLAAAAGIAETPVTGDRPLQFPGWINASYI